MTPPRKLYVKSFGCQMNVYDSHRMADMLAPEGFAETAHIEDADLVILNTCHIREKAADKVYILRAPSRAATRARGVSAFVTVQEGCDKFCTFCVVPYTRGAEVSRPVIKIVAEVERLADAGVREVTLIGQNVNAYHGEGPDGRAWTLGRLLHRVAEVAGIARLRYTTSHPCDMEASLVAAHRDLPSLMPYLHLPVQSGSDR